MNIVVLEKSTIRLNPKRTATCPAGGTVRVGNVLNLYSNRKKWWTRARAFIKFFKPKNNGSGEPAKQPQHSPPGPLEATPSCSYWVEEQDAPSEPPPKGKRGDWAVGGK